MRGRCAACQKAVCEHHGAHRKPVLCTECSRARWETEQARAEAQRTEAERAWQETLARWRGEIDGAVARLRERGESESAFLVPRRGPEQCPHGWVVPVGPSHFGVGSDGSLYVLRREVSSRLLRADLVTWHVEKQVHLPTRADDVTYTSAYGPTRWVLTPAEAQTLMRAIKRV